MMTGSDQGQTTDELKEESPTELLVYPNPSEGIVNIRCSELINSIKVMDINGQIVFKAVELETNFYRPELVLPIGVYLIEVTTFSGVKTERITVN